MERKGSVLLGLSLTKILFTALVIVVVWKGFALLGRHASERRASVADAAERHRQRRAREAKSGAESQPVELVPCPTCGAYIDARVGCSRCQRGENGQPRPT